MIESGDDLTHVPLAEIPGRVKYKIAWHMVTLVDYGLKEVRVLDSNDNDGRVRTMPLKRFLSWWDGFALVIELAESEE